MIVCICNRINCAAVKAAVRDGARAPKDVQSHNGCEFNCGKCKKEIQDLIGAEIENSVASQRLIPAE